MVLTGLGLFSPITAAMVTPDDATDLLAFAERVLGPQKTRPLQPDGKEYDLYHLTAVYLSGRNGIALARTKEGDAIVAMMAVQSFDPVYHVEHVDDVHAFAADYGYTPETTAVYRRTLIDERYPRLPILRALVKEADRFARAQGYRWVYRHCHHNDLPVMLQWKRVGYAITEEDFSTGSIHMCKTL
jgi:GNAT superfamily N-acetyltransferase